jgi:hypothetical protein
MLSGSFANRFDCLVRPRDEANEICELMIRRCSRQAVLLAVSRSWQSLEHVAFPSDPLAATPQGSLANPSDIQSSKRAARELPKGGRAIAEVRCQLGKLEKAMCPFSILWTQGESSTVLVVSMRNSEADRISPTLNPSAENGFARKITYFQKRGISPAYLDPGDFGVLATDPSFALHLALCAASEDSIEESNLDLGFFLVLAQGRNASRAVGNSFGDA